MVTPLAPELTLEKTFVSGLANNDGTYTVRFTVTVTNTGDGFGAYSLNDMPSFDGDIVIESGSYTGAFTGILNTTGSTTLATNAVIAANSTATFNLTYIVSLTVPDGQDESSVYNACGENGSSTPVPGEGLFNRAFLDTNGDGTIDQTAEDCGDLEFPCEIMVTITQGPICNDNGTPSDATDDFYTFTILVTGANTAGSTWTTINGIEAAYGEEVTITRTDFTADGDDPMILLVGVTDAVDPTCSAVVEITRPYTCSDLCDISADVTTSPYCDDNGTPTDPDDDVFFARVTVNGLNTGGSWTATDDEGNVVGSGFYGTPTEIGPFAQQEDEEVVVTIRDAVDGNCVATVVLDQPISFPCSDQCVINMEQINAFCDNNGTPSDASDDLYFVQVLITANASAGWNAPAFGYFGCTPYTDPNGSGVIFGPFTASQVATIQVFSCNDPSGSCTASLTVTKPADFPCSNECAITGTIGNPVCNDNGTPADPSDDTFTVSVVANEGANNSGAYKIEVDNVVFGGLYAYGVPTVVGPLPIFDTNGNPTQFEIEVRDAASIYCRVARVVNAPAPCSNESSCNIVASLSQVNCLDNGSDSYTATLSVTNNASIGTYTVSGGGVNTTGTYGTNLILNFDNAAGQTINLTITDNQSGDCFTTTSFAAPVDCTPTVCNLNASISVVGCVEGQVGQFTATLQVTNAGEAGNYTVSGGGISTLGTYGTDLVLNFPTANGQSVSLTITAGDDVDCTTTVQFAAPDECPPACNLTASVQSVTCNPAPNQNDFNVTILVTNEGLATTYQIIGNGIDTTGTYGEALVVNIAQAEGQTLDYVITDVEDPTCGTTLVLDAPTTCMEECTIIAMIGDKFCDDNGTPDNPNDDTYTAEITVMGQNGQYTLTYNIPNTLDPIVGTFGQTIIVGPFPAGMDANITVRGLANMNCVATATIDAPTCEAACAITAEVVEIDCSDAGTTNQADDTYTANVVITGNEGSSAAYIATFSNGATQVVGLYSVNTATFGPFQIADGNVTITLTDAADPTCTQQITLMAPPAGCGNCTIESTITADFNSCDDEGTPFDPSDDTFTATLTVTGSNTGSGWMTTDGQFAGEYGESITIPGLPSGSLVTFTIVDNEDSDCNTTATVQGPVCQGLTCNIEASVISTDCDDAGTPTAENDDTFTATITVANNAGGSWITQDGAFTGNYNEPTVIGPFTTAQDVILVIQDSDTDACQVTLLIPTSGSCSDTECEITAQLIGEAVCTDNGYAIQVVVTDNGGGSAQGWTSSTGAGGQYGETVTIVITDFTQSTTITFMDADNEFCMAQATLDVQPPTITVTAPADTSTIDGLDLICTDLLAIFNSESSFAITGQALTEGCGIEDTGFDDTILSGGDCAADTIQRVFFAIGENGSIVRDTQLIIIRKPELTDVIFPSQTFTFDCDASGFPLTIDGYPSPDTTGYPIIITAFDTIVITEEYCEGFLTVDFTDVSSGGCGGETITRTWTATSICVDTVATGQQTLIIGDFSAPVLECPISNHYCPIIEENIMLFPSDPFDCQGTLTIPFPTVTDVCASSYSITTVIIDANGNTLFTINEGDDRTITLPLGDFTVRYSVLDECGNSDQIDCIIRVADTAEPAAICISHINVSVGGFGLARVYANLVNLGSYDNCGIDSVIVRRVDTLGGLTIFGQYGNFVTLDCEDAGSTVEVELRVVDFAGNANHCTTQISVVDNTLPYCTGLVNQTIACTELPFDFDPIDTLDLQQVFGFPTVIDNCAAEAIELAPIYVGDECGTSGIITRRWLAIDAIGNVATQVFTQTITITSDNNFAISLPADTLTECIDIDQGLEIIGGGCALIETSFADTLVQALPGEEEACYVFERTYLIVNSCVYDGVSAPVVIGRDEDCDGIFGEQVFALSQGDSTYIDVDTSAFNNVPVLNAIECGNPQGHLRSAVNVGAWIYVQRIAVIDTTAPVITYTLPQPSCITEEDDCQATIRAEVFITNECTSVQTVCMVLVDLDSDGSIDLNLTGTEAVSDSFPYFIIETVLPLGQHNLMVRYIDGCMNAGSRTIPVSVVDCTIPEATCYSGLITELAALPAGTDVDGDGDFEEAAATVQAAVLASCQIEDCSGPLRFSVNRIGVVPSVDSTSVTLTCDDRYTVDLEVYMWDNAFNPFAVQPDSTIGGPNWTMCVVQVFVQDPDLVCNDCTGDNLVDLAGDVIRFNDGSAIPGVEMHLSGTESKEVLSQENGKFLFSGLTVSGDYVMSAHKNDDTTNGLSTLDILILRAHILGMQTITSPYLLVAADVNNNGAITTMDELILRSVLLGNITEFPTNTSWRFFTEALTTNPQGGQLPANVKESIVIEDMVHCQFGHVFTGVKIGDLNGSATLGTATQALGAEERSGRESWSLRLEDRLLQAGQTYEIPVMSGELNDIAGFQFTLEAATEGVSILAGTPALLGADKLGTTPLLRNKLTTSWNRTTEISAGTARLFTLRLQVSETMKLSEAIRLGDLPTVTEAYDRAWSPMDVHLTFSQPTASQVINPIVDKLLLEQNEPNPYRGHTFIGFNLPRAGSATLTVTDLTGRTLRVITDEYEAGAHRLRLDGSFFAPGTYFYTLTAGNERATRAMIIGR